MGLFLQVVATGLGTLLDILTIAMTHLRYLMDVLETSFVGPDRPVSILD